MNEIWRRPASCTGVKLAAAVVLLGAAGAWAIGEGPNMVGAEAVYKETDAGLNDDLKTRLDGAIGATRRFCVNPLDQTSAQINYSISPTTLPRNDYQRLGERAEAVRAYLMVQHGFWDAAISFRWSVGAAEPAQAVSGDAVFVHWRCQS